MKILVYAIRDSAVEAYLAPLFYRTKGEAIRNFSDAVNKPGGGFFEHPEHYSLWHLGAYDDANGALLPLELPVPVINAVDLLSDQAPRSGAPAN